MSATPQTTITTERSVWRRVPERGTILGIRFVVWLCRVFGRRAAGAFLRILCVYYALFDVKARRASRAYLARVGLPLTFRSVVNHIWHFARVTLDRYLFLAGRIDEFEVNLHGSERIHGAVKGANAEPGVSPRQRGAILLGSHLGSFEAMRAVASRDAVPLTVIVDFRTAARLNAVFADLCPNLDVRMIGLDATRATSMLDVKERIDRGELVAILGDRSPDRRDRTVTADFLGSEATFPMGPYLLAHMLNCPVYLVFALFYPPNRYEVYCEPFADAIRLPRASRNEAAREYAQKYAERLEAFARKAPYNWFNFFDFWG